MNRCISRSAILKAGILALMVALVIFGAFAALSVKADAAEAATEYTNTQGLTSTFLLYNADTKGDPISGHEYLNEAISAANAEIIIIIGIHTPTPVSARLPISFI